VLAEFAVGEGLREVEFGVFGSELGGGAETGESFGKEV